MGSRRLAEINLAKEKPRGVVRVQVRGANVVFVNMGVRFDPKKCGYCNDCNLEFVNQQKGNGCIFVALLGDVNSGNRLVMIPDKFAFPIVAGVGGDYLPPCLKQFEGLEDYQKWLRERNFGTQEEPRRKGKKA